MSWKNLILWLTKDKAISFHFVYTLLTSLDHVQPLRSITLSYIYTFPCIIRIPKNLKMQSNIKLRMTWTVRVISSCTFFFYVSRSWNNISNLHQKESLNPLSKTGKNNLFNPVFPSHLKLRDQDNFNSNNSDPCNFRLNIFVMKNYTFEWRFKQIWKRIFPLTYPMTPFSIFWSINLKLQYLLVSPHSNIP